MTQYENKELEKLLYDCRLALYCPTGKFYPHKNYGSKIRLENTSDVNYLLAYARQALLDFSGVYVKSAETSNGNALFKLIINDIEGTVTLTLEDDI